MRIVAHNGSPKVGGGEIAPARLLHSLQSRGHSVLMLCRDQRVAAEISAVADIPTGVQYIGGGAVLSHAVAFAARLRGEKPDAVFLTSFKKVFLAGLGARLARVPRIVQRIVLEGDTPARGPQYRFAFRHFVDAIVLNADAMRAAFLQADRKLDPSSVYTLHDGVSAPVRTRPPGSLRDELGIAAHAPVVGAVARLVKQKRIDRLVCALADLPEDTHCVIAGDGPQRDALLSLAESHGLLPRLHLLGFRQDVGDVLDALDLFVISSEREGMANAMLEALAFGVPVVSTPVSGAAESLDAFPDGIAPGLITEPDVASLAAALSALLRDRTRLAAMSAAARRRAQERFSEAAFVDGWEKVLAGTPAGLTR